VGYGETRFDIYIYIYIYIWIEGKHLMQEKENKKEIAVEIVASEDK
jgi:hypothetical protein